MARYGPIADLRNPLELVEVGDLLRQVEFKVFAEAAAAPGSRVAALRAPGGSVFSRKQLDDYASFVAIYGAKGLAYIRVNDRAAGLDGLQSPILKFLPPDVVENILVRTGAASGDVVFFGADSATVVPRRWRARSPGGRSRSGRRGAAPAVGGGFPMFEWDAEGRCRLHHLFTAASGDLQQGALSRAYDMVLNGSEIGGGSIASTARKCSVPCSACWASMARKRTRSSASCWKPCNTVVRRTAASPSASIAWSC